MKVINLIFKLFIYNNNNINNNNIDDENVLM